MIPRKDTKLKDIMQTKTFCVDARVHVHVHVRVRARVCVYVVILKFVIFWKNQWLVVFQCTTFFFIIIFLNHYSITIESFVRKIPGNEKRGTIFPDRLLYRATPFHTIAFY